MNLGEGLLGLLVVLGSGAGRYRQNMMEYERHRQQMLESQLKLEALKQELESKPRSDKSSAMQRWESLVQKGRELEKSEGVAAAQPYYDAANELSREYGLPSVKPYGAVKSGVEGLEAVASLRSKLGLQGRSPNDPDVQSLMKATWDSFVKEYPHLGSYFASLVQQSERQLQQRQQQPEQPRQPLQLSISPADLYQTAVQRGLLMPPSRGPLAASPSLPSTGSTPPLSQPPLGAWTPVQRIAPGVTPPAYEPAAPPLQSPQPPLEPQAPPEPFVKYMTAPDPRDIRTRQQVQLAAMRTIVSQQSMGRLSPEGAYEAYKVMVPWDTETDFETFKTIYNDTLAALDKANLEKVRVVTDRIAQAIDMTAKEYKLKVDWQAHKKAFDNAMLDIAQGRLDLGWANFRNAAAMLALAIDRENRLDVQATNALAVRYAQLGMEAELYESTKDLGPVYRSMSDAFRAIAARKEMQRSGGHSAPGAPVSQKGAPSGAPTAQPKLPGAPEEAAAKNTAWARKPGETAKQYIQRVMSTRMSKTDPRPLVKPETVAGMRKKGWTDEQIANALEFMLGPEER